MHGPSESKGGVVEAQVHSNKKRKVDNCHPLEVAFGLPWTWETFVNKAVHSQHLFVQGTGVALELQEAINKHVEWNDEQLCKYRLVQKVVDSRQAVGPIGEGKQFLSASTCG